eukprot:jgi/Botrbrau1/22254/Bobra.0138s0016.1
MFQGAFMNRISDHKSAILCPSRPSSRSVRWHGCVRQMGQVDRLVYSRVSPNRNRIPARLIVNAVEDSRRETDVEVEVSATSAATVQPVWKSVLTTLAKTAAVAVLAAGLALGHVDPALAANSGGRVGGSNFSAARSGSYGGSMRSAPSAPSSGYSGVAPGLGAGVGISTYNSFGFGYGLSPWGFGGYGGYGYPAPVVVSSGPSIFDLFIWGAIALIAFSAISSFFNGGDSDFDSERVTVGKLQVGLLGSARGLKRDLDRIAGRANTNSSSGLNYVLQETVLALMRNPEYAIYGTATTKQENDLDEGEASFNEVVMQERSKFREETLVNVSGIERRSTYSRGGDVGGLNELIVITIVVAVQGKLKLPNVSNREELNTALGRLGAIPSDNLMAVEVMWTPEADNDFYTRDEMFQDYPTLNTL